MSFAILELALDFCSGLLKVSVEVLGVELNVPCKGVFLNCSSGDEMLGVVPRVVGDCVGVSEFRNSWISSWKLSKSVLNLSADVIAGTNRGLGGFSAKTVLGRSRAGNINDSDPDPSKIGWDLIFGKLWATFAVMVWTFPSAPFPRSLSLYLRHSTPSCATVFSSKAPSSCGNSGDSK